MSFPRDRGDLSPQVYLTLLLVSIVKQHNGELRIPALLLDTIKGGESIVHDYDSRTQELVLRAATACAEMLALPEESKWHAPDPRQSSAPPAQPTVIPSSPRTTIDDERTAALERKLAADKMTRRRNSALTDFFSTSPAAAERKAAETETDEAAR